MVQALQFENFRSLDDSSLLLVDGGWSWSESVRDAGIAIGRSIGNTKNTVVEMVNQSAIYIYNKLESQLPGHSY